MARLVARATTAVVLAVFAAAVLAEFAPVSSREQADVVVEYKLSPALRVATIGYRLAAAGRCPSQTMLTGLVLHDRAAYDEALRNELTHLGWGFGVRGAVSGSPADEVGLMEGDEIVALGTHDLRDYRKDIASRSGTFARTEAFTALLAAALQVGPARLTMLRDGRESVIVLPQRSGCSVGFTLVPGRSPDAWTDGHYVAVTNGMEQRTGDDALAFAMAHELGHIVLGHSTRTKRPFAVIGIGAGRARKEELDADRLAVHILHSAGFNPAGGQGLFEVLRGGSVLRRGLTHPSIRARIAAVDEEVARLEDQRAFPALPP